ncbi:hypothetical protein GCM10009790_14960 [Georgenia ruanii]
MERAVRLARDLERGGSTVEEARVALRLRPPHETLPSGTAGGEEPARQGVWS